MSAPRKRNGDEGPLAEARARALLQQLTGPEHQGVLRLTGANCQLLNARAGLDRGWLRLAVDGLVADGLATVEARGGCPTLTITDKGRRT